MGMPVAALSAVMRPIRLSAAERVTILRVYVPWNGRTGRSAKHFMNVYDEKEFESDLGELRQRMQICRTINYDHTSKGTLNSYFAQINENMFIAHFKSFFHIYFLNFF